MNKIKLFFRVFQKSLTTPKYYKDILKAPLSFSLKYLYALLFLMSLFSALLFSIRAAIFIPQIPRFVETIKDTVRDIYPDDLVVTLKDGQVSTNQKEPYVVGLPKELPDLIGENLVTIDTKSSVTDYPRYQSLVLVTKDSIAIFDDKNNFQKDIVSYKVIPLSETDFAQNAVLNKGIYLSLVNEVLPFLDYLPAISYILIAFALIVFPFVGAAFAMICKLFYLLFVAAILWLFTKLGSQKYSYKKLYQLTIHATTLIILLTAATKLVGVHFPGFINLLILLGYSAFIIYKIKN